MTYKPREYVPVFYKGYLLDEEGHIAVNEGTSLTRMR